MKIFWCLLFFCFLNLNAFGTTFYENHFNGTSPMDSFTQISSVGAGANTCVADGVWLLNLSQYRGTSTSTSIWSYDNGGGFTIPQTVQFTFISNTMTASTTTTRTRVYACGNSTLSTAYYFIAFRGNGTNTDTFSLSKLNQGTWAADFDTAYILQNNDVVSMSLGNTVKTVSINGTVYYSEQLTGGTPQGGTFGFAQIAAGSTGQYKDTSLAHFLITGLESTPTPTPTPVTPTLSTTKKGNYDLFFRRLFWLGNVK